MTRLERLRREVASFPQAPGVYVMADASGREVYVGKALRLRDRVRSYFQDPARLDEKTRALVSAVRSVAFIETASEVEALILESRLIKDMQPQYNVRLRSNDQYALVEIPWREDFPAPKVTREKGHAGSRYYGPFVDVSGLRAALKVLRRAFPFRTCARSMVAPRGAVAPRDETRGVRPCLNFHIGLCPAPCAGRITRAAYRKTLERLGLFLRGRKDEVLEGLREAMARAAAALDFEEAARLRDEIAAIESLERRGSLSDGIEPAPPPVDPRRAAGEAGEALGLGRPARTIEGVDVANLGGGDAVGAVVAFADGSPQKGGYRRFRIRGERTRDDYEMIREVVRRRYSRLMRERSSVEGVILPDVILVDGGVGHLRAAAKVVRELGFDVTVVAIAKERDSRGRKKGRGAVDRVLTLARPRGVEFPRGSAALRLLQFVRDEAHRFAQHYHHIRARKRLTDRGR